MDHGRDTPRPPLYPPPGWFPQYTVDSEGIPPNQQHLPLEDPADAPRVKRVRTVAFTPDGRCLIIDPYEVGIYVRQAYGMVP